MIEAAQPHPHHQHHRQVQDPRQVRRIDPLVERNPKSTHAFHPNHFRQRAQSHERLADHPDIDGTPRLQSSDMRRDKRVVEIRIHPVQRRLNRTGGQQPHDIVVAPVRFDARRDRLHADGGQTLLAGGVQQGASNMGFTDPRIRASHEICVVHKPSTFNL